MVTPNGIATSTMTDAMATLFSASADRRRNAAV